MALTLTTGDDSIFIVPLTKNKQAFVINTGAVVRAAIVSLDGLTVLAGPITCSSSDSGADWNASKVATVFTRTDTTPIIDYGPAKLEIEVDDGGRLTWTVELMINNQGII